MVKHFLCILFSVITLNHSHCQYLYEEFTFMWQSIDSVKYELEKDSFQLTKTLKDEHCIFNAFKKEAKHISFECCNETKDSITSIKEITSDFSHLLGIHKQLRLNENLEHTDTTICQYPTKVYRDDLDYEIVLVFDSEMDIYSYQINYFSDFEFIKTNIESIFNCDDSNTYLDRVLQIFEAENSKGNSIKSHFTSAPRIEYHSFENFSSQILDFRNSPEYDDLLKEYQKHFIEDEVYQNNIKSVFEELSNASLSYNPDPMNQEKALIQNLVLRDNFIAIILAKHIFG